MNLTYIRIENLSELSVKCEVNETLLSLISSEQRTRGVLSPDILNFNDVLPQLINQHCITALGNFQYINLPHNVLLIIMRRPAPLCLTNSSAKHFRNVLWGQGPLAFTNVSLDPKLEPKCTLSSFLNGNGVSHMIDSFDSCLRINLGKLAMHTKPWRGAVTYKLQFTHQNFQWN